MCVFKKVLNAPTGLRARRFAKAAVLEGRAKGKGPLSKYYMKGL